MSGGDLSARVEGKVARRRDEIGELARDFDAMAERIEALVGAQQRLLRDVSHELRSPLARLVVALELARSRAGEAAAETAGPHRTRGRSTRRAHRPTAAAASASRPGRPGVTPSISTSEPSSPRWWPTPSSRPRPTDREVRLEAGGPGRRPRPAASCCAASSTTSSETPSTIPPAGTAVEVELQRPGRRDRGHRARSRAGRRRRRNSNGSSNPSTASRRRGIVPRAVSVSASPSPRGRSGRTAGPSARQTTPRAVWWSRCCFPPNDKPTVTLSERVPPSESKGPPPVRTIAAFLIVALSFGDSSTRYAPQNDNHGRPPSFHQ